MPRYEPFGEGLLSLANTSATPSPEPVEFSEKGVILRVNVVEIIAGQACTGRGNKTLPTFLVVLDSVELELLLGCGSGVRLKYPLPAVAEPMQSSSPLVQLSEVKVTKEKVLWSATVHAPSRKLKNNKSMINMVVVLCMIILVKELRRAFSCVTWSMFGVHVDIYICGEVFSCALNFVLCCCC